jgi:hypothetical protein
MAAFADRKVIIGSVAKGPYSNLGNTLIERATLRCLGLPNETPMFSVFEPMTPQRAHTLNSFDLVVFTGCTLLQASEGHQRFLNAACDRISVPKLCFAGAFCAQLHDEPALEVARWFEPPIAVRDPWSAVYLTRMGIANRLVGCPTLLDGSTLLRWRKPSSGVTLVSSTPILRELFIEDLPGELRFVSHEFGAPGRDLRTHGLLDAAQLCITGRLHLALPAIARGIPVRFFGPRHWVDERIVRTAGPSRFSLLEFLNISTDGILPKDYPTEQISELRSALQTWKRDF